MKNIKNNGHRIALLIIMALAGFLTFYSIGNEGYANQYYSAAVRSMLTSWHNFFFASFDPGGYVTVDKPALGLWLQAISAWIFGFHGWSLILPEALSTVVSVALIYHLVKRAFGNAAGLTAALILAVTPILIAVSRTNNLDASLVMLLLLASWALIKAAEKSSFKLLLLSMALVGLGFNIKMLEAFMVLPAFYLVYFITARLKTARKLLHLTAATVLLLTVSLSWAVIVDLTPADQRPYIGSSKSNSVLELALGYNGIQRLTGRDAGFGSGRAVGNPGSAVQPGNAPSTGRPRTTEDRQRDGAQSPGQMPAGDQNSPNRMGQPPDGNVPGGNAPEGFDGARGGQGGPGGGGPGGSGENGQKGFFRIFNQQLAGQISWFIPMAFFGMLILALRAFDRRRKDRETVIRYFLFWSACLIPMLAFFSIAGFYHRYYLSMLAPATAALSGIGAVELWKAYMQRGWKWVLLPTALLVTAVLQASILWRSTGNFGSLAPIVLGSSLVSVTALIVIRLLNKDSLRNTIKLAVAVGMAALLVAPSVWSYTPVLYGSQTTLPVAGPELSRGNGGRTGGQGMPGGMNPPGEADGTSRMVDFLLNNKQGEKYLVAVASSNAAAPIIIETGEAVMAVGGFSGSDSILTVERLEAMVKAGEIRYFLTDGMGRGMGGQSQIANWVAEHGEAVSSDLWSDSAPIQSGTGARPGMGRSMGQGTVLYDLAPEKGTHGGIENERS